MILKEIIAIVRPNKMLSTKRALEEMGFSSFTAFKVLGRGKQGGRLKELAYRVSPEVAEKLETTSYAFIPKRLLSVVVPEAMVPRVVERIIRVNQTGEHGDGKIFVLPVEEVLRVRTGETGLSALF
ncbi:P-II family nitrogen regulator [Thermosulfurimonas sp. F29]|uniref:P-II family nitrogen regulator n=1 Tax=Thermosulfurimonas sp. F29 TaxID=2867247 RepID=UPI001C84052D|nr:P-II family nitrogen regulator [Thermosulfurimonas sp. F29]MBX6423088.1 P-II family nitrogen regulator [Thermosulfurimonas sp. F29]